MAEVMVVREGGNVPLHVALGISEDEWAKRDNPDPCRCHQTLSDKPPNHPGHCCFSSPVATCHQAEVDDWEARKVLQALGGGG